MRGALRSARREWPRLSPNSRALRRHASRGADRAFAGVSTDTRTLEPGELFVALRGPRFDGHDFVAGAAERGAAGAVVETPRTIAAAAGRRARHAGGADRARARLARAVRDARRRRRRQQRQDHGQGNDRARSSRGAGPTLATRGNLNNHIGVPLTLLRLEPTHRYAVDRDGRESPGRDRRAGGARAARRSGSSPTPAPSISRASAASRASRAPRARCSRRSAADGTAVINADDAFAALWRGMTRAARASDASASTQPADFARAAICSAASSRGGFVTRFTLRDAGGQAPIELHARRAAQRAQRARRGRGRACRRRDARRRSSPASPQCARLPAACSSKPRRSGAWLIDDSYNANPSSVRAGIDVLARVPTASAGWCSATWRELGDDADREPRGDRRLRAPAPASTRLFAIGTLRALAVEAFGPGARVVRRRRRAGATRVDARARRATSPCWSRARASTGSSAWSSALVVPLPAAGNGTLRSTCCYWLAELTDAVTTRASTSSAT